MSKPQDLKLLATSTNAIGDLFTRLVSDLFYSLGYDNLRLDVQKAGREIDIQGEHRHEARSVVAECKAHQKKMGGADLNKFLGAVTRERSKGKQVAGYFVSLGGFSESGIEQENETDNQVRIITMDAADVIQELINANMLVSLDVAAESAGRCAQYSRIDGDLSKDGTQLLGHEIGYVWALYFSHNKNRTHLALIHADGTPLAKEVAEKVIQADRDCGGIFHELQYLVPAPPFPNREEASQEAMEKYREWLVAECGYIQLDGLPADTDLSALRMRLERLYVPMKVQRSKGDEKETVNVGEFLASHSRFSILAKPGGGKSTLLKRLAVAYVDRSRLDKSDDALPQKDWMPLFLRCRELRDRVNTPIRKLLTDLGRQAEMNVDCADAFCSIVDEALKSGRVLLLVDGLDEFADAGNRTTFASHLRTFLAMFPNVSLVVTSREAGFRQIASVVDSVCDRTTMAPFDEKDVYSLCRRWHTEVVGNTEAIRTESDELAGTIWKNERIRALAENPLMLTTLLVVRRNVGELPTKRVKLYQAAVDVLVRTWNVEGFAPLDEEETLARLSYVAVAMMSSGQQQIGRQQLLRLLQEAQQELEVELQFAEVSPNQFIDRIEYRSSLLMQTGYEEINGELQEIFEFRHLTFQEYLAARGVVKEQYPDREKGETVPALIRPYLEDDNWREVIPLTAVLADRRDTEAIISELIEKCELVNYGTSFDPYRVLLRRCVLDEIHVTQKTLRAALRQVARGGPSSFDEVYFGKFSKVFQDEVEESFFSGDDNWEQYSSAFAGVAALSLLPGAPDELTEPSIATLESYLRAPDRVQQASAALATMHIAFEVQFKRLTINESLLKRLRDQVASFLSLEDPQLNHCAAWALAWSGQSLQKAPVDVVLIRRLYQLWRQSEFQELARFAGWAFSTQPLLARDTFAENEWGDVTDLLDLFSIVDVKQDSDLAMVVAYYNGFDWSDEELAKKICKWVEEKKKNKDTRLPTLIPLRILRALGETGRNVIELVRSDLETYELSEEEQEILDWGKLN